MVGPRSSKQTEAGIVIGGYELVRRIGRGGMAEVWVARKALGKKGSKFVAIKLIADHFVGDERYARMFRAEAELAAVLSHANIVQVFDEGEDQDRSYLIMEWVDGLNLLKLGDMLALLGDEQRRFRVISYIIGQLLHALHYAHSITSHDGSPLGVVHRDVSPQNVLVSNHGEVKLTDFGVAFHNFEESSGIHVKGKVRYMSPEQLSGQSRSPTVDLYAVGALLHELLDGRKFRGEFEDGQDLFSVVLSGKVSALSRPIPPELDRLRLGLLEPDPTRRIQSAEDAITLLKRYPGYGDARDELTKLCGSLTGVVRPRVGPGQSSQMAAADQATTRWGGRNPLAKPKVASGLGRPPLPPPPKRATPPSVAPRTGSTTAVKSGQDDVAAAQVHVALEALITGQTEFVRREDLQGLIAAQASPVSSSAPTAPLRASDLRGISSAPAPHGPGPGDRTHGQVQVSAAPGYVAVQPSSPLDMQGGGYGGPAPTHVEGQPSSLLDVAMGGRASVAPRYVHGQGSHPIQVQPGSGWGEPSTVGGRVPPTERLPSSEVSGVASNPGSTAVLDPYMIIEVSSGSGTEQDIVPPQLRSDGTDTSREVRPVLPTQSHSIGIPRRSAVAVIGLGLVLVAVLSVSVTWYVFTRGHDDATTGTEIASGLAARVEQPKASAASDDERAEAVEAEAVEAETPPEPGLQAEAPQAPDEGSNEDVATLGGPEELEDPPQQELLPDAGVQEPPSDETAGPVAAPSAARTKTPRAKAAKPRPDAAVKVTSSSGLEKAQILVGGAQTLSVNERTWQKITSGKQRLKWRRVSSDPWQSAKSASFAPDGRFIIHIGKKGPVVRSSK